MRHFAMAALALASLACGSGSSGTGTLEAEWRGADRGQFTATAAAVHCPESGIVLVEGIRADSGVALALFPSDSAVIAAGEYPVTSGNVAEVPRPGALAAVRAFNTAELRAWESYAGMVTIATGDDRLDGDFQLRLRLTEGVDTLWITGTLRDVPVVADTIGCGLTLRRNF